jgi:hypothetical protein
MDRGISGFPFFGGRGRAANDHHRATETVRIDSFNGQAEVELVFALAP